MSLKTLQKIHINGRYATQIGILGMTLTRHSCQIYAVDRRLVVLKLWQAWDTFDPARLMWKFQDGRGFD